MVLLFEESPDTLPKRQIFSTLVSTIDKESNPLMTNSIGHQILRSFLPSILKENVEVATFLALLTYVLFLVNWLVTTDWIEKLHLFSGAICAIGVFHLHYSEVAFLATYEVPFVTLWLALLWYHYSTWRNNYERVSEELSRSTVAASMRPFQGSIFRFLIAAPLTKNASNQWCWLLRTDFS